MAKYLTVRPANLRQLAKNNGGKFPFWEVYHKIDGQTEVRAHGTREMPVWGRSKPLRSRAMGALESSTFSSGREAEHTLNLRH